MQTTKKTVTVLIALLMVAAAAAAQRQWSVTGQAIPELSAVDLMMQDIMQTHSIRGSSVAIAKDGRLVYARGFTWDDPSVEPIQPTTLFRIASISKSITSIAVHQLIEDGTLSYDTEVMSGLEVDPLWDWRVDPRLDSVTVDHMLTHTSGMYSEDNIYEVDGVVAAAHGVGQPTTRKEIASYIVANPFLFDSGTAWDYNNYGYIMLGMLVEQVTGQDFPEFVFENIFRPVGVSRARLPHTLPSDLAPTETTYDGLEGDPYAVITENAFAAGLMVMSAPDLARVYSALFDDPEASGLLDNGTVDQMLSIPFAAGEEVGYGRGWVNEDFFTNSGHTVGWLTNPNDQHQVFGHGGGGGGVHTLAVWRSDGIVFVIFTNKDPIAPTIDFPEITSWPDHDLWETVFISTEPVGSATAESWIPAVAHADGVGDSTWRSDVGLLNRSSRTNVVRLRLHRGNQPVDREVELAPGESRVISDAVEWFGRSGSGPLQVFSSEGLTVTSRTYNQSIDGTFGQSLDGVTATGGLESGESAVLMQLQEDDAARTNIGIHNQWRRSAVVEIALFDGDGSLITGHTREIAPQQTVQLNRPFFKLGHRDDVASGYAVITVVSGQDVYASASVIDNVTGDPTSIPMKTGQGHHLQWIAAAVHGEGAHESQWRTDLSLLNRSGETATVDVRFRGDNGTSSNVVVTLDDGEQRTIGDVVASVGAEGSGSVEIQSSSPVMVASRTYNASDFGTYGLFLDGISGADSCREGGTVWLPHLLQNDLFRTNVGLVNTGETEARMRVTFFDSSGVELASRSRTLGPGGWLQLQEPFARIAGRTDIDAGYATVHVQSGQGLIAYASVIDNRTNDGTAISMKR